MINIDKLRQLALDGDFYAIQELIDRIEAAERNLSCCRAEREEAASLFLSAKTRLTKERDELRAKIEQMEKQEPIAWTTELALELGSSALGFDACRNNLWGENGVSLYALPGAQPAQIEQDTSVRKSWARFSNELHRSHDAPYPGMSEAFEQHFSQSFTDREWRAESATWAAAWKAAKRHGAQPAPFIPEGWKLVPTAESRHPGIYKMLSVLHAVDNTPGASEWESYAAFLAAAPEAKP